MITKTDKKIETVLFVDDDNAIRKVCSLALERCGYAVLQAENADAALKVWDEHSHDIDLLVTDMVMPGESGLELVDRLRASKPSLKVLIISGYCAQFFGSAAGIPKFFTFVCKPFAFQGLANCVRECLDSPISEEC